MTTPKPQKPHIQRYVKGKEIPTNTERTVVKTVKAATGPAYIIESNPSGSFTIRRDYRLTIARADVANIADALIDILEGENA